MKPHRQATKSAALAGALCACLALPAPAEAARRQAITGKLDQAGLVVVTLAADGSAKSAPARPRFRLVPPARTVTLHVRDRAGTYLGPVVVAGRDGRVTLGVRAGARLGRIELRNGYARVSRRPARRSIDRRVTARARGGKPLGTGPFGGLPPRAQAPRAGTRPGPAGPGPQAAGGGNAGDSDTADAALVVAIAAAGLAAAAVTWQLLASLARRRRRIEVDVRLGLPIYPQGGGDWSVFVEVLNGTAHPVRWIDAALELRDGRRLHLMHQPPGGELPAVLQPHDSHQTWAPCRILEQGGFELDRPVVALAKLDSGETARSRRRRLVSRSARR